MASFDNKDSLSCPFRRKSSHSGVCKKAPEKTQFIPQIGRTVSAKESSQLIYGRRTQVPTTRLPGIQPPTSRRSRTRRGAARRSSASAGSTASPRRDGSAPAPAGAIGDGFALLQLLDAAAAGCRFYEQMSQVRRGVALLQAMLLFRAVDALSMLEARAAKNSAERSGQRMYIVQAARDGGEGCGRCSGSSAQFAAPGGKWSARAGSSRCQRRAGGVRQLI